MTPSFRKAYRFHKKGKPAKAPIYYRPLKGLGVETTRLQSSLHPFRSTGKFFLLSEMERYRVNRSGFRLKGNRSFVNTSGLSHNDKRGSFR